MKKQANKAKKYYDRKVRCSKLHPGDLVLVKQFGQRGKHKIQDRWENTIYEVLESCHRSPLVFRVRREDGTGKIRILHRNLLLPLRTRILEDEITPTTQEPDESENVNLTGPTEEPIQENQDDSSEDEQDSNSVSEDDEDKVVSTRPWTRSQGPPPALVGTKNPFQMHSKHTPSMIINQEGGQNDVPIGYTGRVIGWASSIWEDLQLFLH